jgi:hypothetical protein
MEASGIQLDMRICPADWKRLAASSLDRIIRERQ